MNSKQIVINTEGNTFWKTSLIEERLKREWKVTVGSDEDNTQKNKLKLYLQYN